jgi:hypothetical protein
MRRTGAFIVGLVCCLAAGEVAAVEVPPMPVGTRLRVHSPPMGLFGDPATLVTMDGSGLIVELEDGARVVLARGDILGLEVSRGRHKATAYGAVVGAALGLTWGAVSQSTPEGSFEERPPSWDPAPLVFGAMLGGILGGVIGSAITFERWQPVYLNPYFHYGANEETGVGLRAAFVF